VLKNHMPHAMFPQPEAWYVVQTKPRQEFRAEVELLKQGFCCFLPTLQAEKIRCGGRAFITEPLFTRYLFVGAESDTQNWAALRSTRGVSHLVKFGGVPARLPSDLIDRFRHESAKPRRLFDVGQRVVVTRGAFAGLEGVYQMPDGQSRAVVLLELLSKPCRGTFPIDALGKVD